MNPQTSVPQLAPGDHTALDKFSPPVRRRLNAMLRDPEGQALIERAEAAEREQRAALAAELRTLTDGEAEAADEKRFAGPTLKAARELKDAEAALRKAQERMAALTVQIAAAPIARLRRVGEIERALRAGCDSRLSDFRIEAGTLLARDEFAIKFHEFRTRAWPGVGHYTKITSNVDDIAAAKAAIEAARVQSFELELSALSYDDITRWFIETIDKLAPLLAVLDTVPPQLDKHAAIEEAPRNPRRAPNVDPDLRARLLPRAH